MDTQSSHNNEIFELMFDRLFDAAFELDGEGRFLRLNSACTALLGYGPKDVSRLRFADIGATLGQDAEMDASVREQLLRFELYPLVLAEKAPVPCTLRTKSKKRIPVIMRSVILRDSNNEILRLLGIVAPERRVAPRRSAAQQEARVREAWETEELYRSILENSGDAVIITDFNGWIVNANDACIRMFGFQRTDEMLGRYLLEFIPMEGSYSSTTGETFVVTGEYYAHQVQQIEHLFETGLSKTRGYLFKKDNTVFPAEATMSLLRDQQGQHRGTITICRDITERSKFEARLSQAREDLERTVLERTQDLQEANTALRVLLKNREDERLALEKKIMSRVHELVEPYVEKLQGAGLNERQQTLLDMLEVNLKNIVAPFEHALRGSNLMLTPMEAQVANLVQHGRTTKDIAGALSLSPKTIEFHRDAIRRKLGIHNKKINLRKYLLSRS
jgi:PAS domain S-box-containing protein